MDKDLEFYLNNKVSNCCSITKDEGYLAKKKFLSEFATQKEKEIAMANLGVLDKLQELKKQIDAKVYEFNATPFDSTPTEGNYDHVVTSDGLSKEFSKYALNADVKEWKENLWQWFLEKAEELTCELNNTLACIQTELNTLEGRINNLEESLDNLTETNLQSQVAELRQLFESYIKTSQGGVAISNTFGDSDLVTISQKALTDAINNLYARLADTWGEPLERVHIEITPEYFISENQYDATITVRTTSDVFENIKIFANGELIVEKENVVTYVHNYVMDETTTFRVEAIILGRLYTEEKTVTKYYPFFVGCGQVWQDIILPENAKTPRVINGNINLQGLYSVTATAGQRFFVIIPKSHQEDIGRIHMNGYDIPFNIQEEEDEYVIYSSKNTYQEGTYTICIQNLNN